MSESNTTGAAGQLIGADAVARHLGIKPKALYYLVAKSKLPVYRMGKKICARAETLNAWIAGQERLVEQTS